MRTAWVTLPESSRGWIISLSLGSMRSGCHRFIPPQWRISDTTLLTIATSIQCSAISPGSTGCLRRSTRAGSGFCSISFQIIRQTNIHGSSKVGRRVRTRSEIGISGAIRRRTEDRRTTGSATSVARPGNGTRPPANITFTLSSSRNPTSTGASPEVREAMMAVLRFWLDRGVDGFRIDVLWHIIKAEALPDNPINADWTPDRTQRDRLIQLYSTDQPEAHAISAEFRALADSYGDRVLIGEICLPNDRLARWYGTPDRPQVHLPFNFQLIENAWDAASLRRTIAAYEASLPRFGWPNWVIGSHDAPRIAARVGEAQARIAAMLLLTLRGTPTLYQGDEIGIGEVQIPPDRVRDPQDLRQPGLGIGRDRSRTPIPWDASAYAGFSTVDPWLPLNEDWRVAQRCGTGSGQQLTSVSLPISARAAAITRRTRNRRCHARRRGGGRARLPAATCRRVPADRAEPRRPDAAPDAADGYLRRRGSCIDCGQRPGASPDGRHARPGRRSRTATEGETLRCA